MEKSKKNTTRKNEIEQRKINEERYLSLWPIEFELMVKTLEKETREKNPYKFYFTALYNDKISSSIFIMQEDEKYRQKAIAVIKKKDEEIFIQTTKEFKKIKPHEFQNIKQEVMSIITDYEKIQDSKIKKDKGR